MSLREISARVRGTERPLCQLRQVRTCLLAGAGVVIERKTTSSIGGPLRTLPTLLRPQVQRVVRTDIVAVTWHSGGCSIPDPVKNSLQ
jgi:hypothetical protein